MSRRSIDDASPRRRTAGALFDAAARALGAVLAPALAAVLSTALSTALASAIALAPAAARAQAVAVPTAPTPIPDSLLEHERNTIEVFRAAGPSVVFVTNNALRRDFFTANVTEVPQGSGSGFLWDRYGHVVTNFHVVQGGQTFSVTLADGTTHEARVVGVEPRKDLAVLHIETKGLVFQPLAIGHSDALLVGQSVIAIGNPFGLDRTLTTGVISALGREFPTDGGFVIEDVIQTDASINPGNSGGPLLDSHGRAIGVNTAIFSPSGASAGIGFAVPIDTVSRIVPQLIRFGKVRRAGLGISVLPDHFARSWGIQGVIVREVAPGSGAARAGLRSLEIDRAGTILGADIIQSVGDKPIRSFADLANALDKRTPGELVPVKVLRDGKDVVEMKIPLVEVQ
ncbi:MAG: trypsin-like peptidase domain-containing protein [Myxococcota bacterium]